jgi:hypothetical protein
LNLDELTRRGYDAEMRRHRENLTRALNEVRDVLDSIQRQVDGGGNAMTSETRRLLAAAGDAVQAAGALSAADQLSFTVDPDNRR